MDQLVVERALLDVLDACLRSLRRERVIAGLEEWRRIDGALIGRTFRAGSVPVAVSATTPHEHAPRHAGLCGPSSCEGLGTRTMTLFGADCGRVCRDALGSDPAFVVHRLGLPLAILTGIPQRTIVGSMLCDRTRSGIQVPRPLGVVTHLRLPALAANSPSLADFLFGEV